MTLIETGDLLAKEAEQDTPEGKRILAAMTEATYGKFVIQVGYTNNNLLLSFLQCPMMLLLALSRRR